MKQKTSPNQKDHVAISIQYLWDEFHLKGRQYLSQYLSGSLHWWHGVLQGTASEEYPAQADEVKSEGDRNPSADDVWIRYT